jgi:enoyl-CoA hydratase/carnithine racemase
LIYSGRRVDAAEALTLGIADRVAAPDALLDEATRWAAELSQHSRTALGLAKSILDRAFDMSLEDTLAAGAQAQAVAYTTAEHHASVAAFNERSARRARVQQQPAPADAPESTGPAQ